MAQSAAAQKPEGQTVDMEEIRENISRVAATAKMQTSLAQSAVWSSSPEAGTVCGSSARTGLCGGCPVRGIPTVLFLDFFVPHFPEENEETHSDCVGT